MIRLNCMTNDGSELQVFRVGSDCVYFKIRKNHAFETVATDPNTAADLCRRILAALDGELPPLPHRVQGDSLERE